MGPINGTQTHGARFARGIEVAAGEVESAQLTAGRTYGLYFGMSRGVVVGRDAVDTGGYHPAVFDNDCPKGTTSVLDVVGGQTNGLAHEVFFFWSHKAWC